LLNQGLFKKNEIPFDLEQKLNEVKSFMLEKIEKTKIKFCFDLNFHQQIKKNREFFELIQYEHMKTNLLQQGRDIEEHPLLKHIAKVNRRSILP
jgi:hypothetical protein